MRQTLLQREEEFEEEDKKKAMKAKERPEAQRVEEWVELVDERTGKTYFCNPRTNATSWSPHAGSHPIPFLGGRGRRGGGGRRLRGRRFGVDMRLLGVWMLPEEYTSSLSFPQYLLLDFSLCPPCTRRSWLCCLCSRGTCMSSVYGGVREFHASST